MFTVTLLARLMVLALESSQKRRALKAPYKGSPPESTNGIFSLLLLGCLNPLLGIGYKENLSVRRLFGLRSSMSADVLLEETSARWGSGKLNTVDCTVGLLIVPPVKQQKRHSLFLVVLEQHKRTLLAGAVARLCLTAFRFAQPFLVEGLLDFINRGSSGSSAEGTWLLVAYAAVYIGTAVRSQQCPQLLSPNLRRICQAGYMYQTHRLVAMIRGGLITLLYRKVLGMDTMKASKSAPVALMSIDTEKIAYRLQTVHQTWGGVIEIALAIWLLKRQLGLAVIGSGLASACKDCRLCIVYLAVLSS